jgi:hypothetical protein
MKFIRTRPDGGIGDIVQGGIGWKARSRLLIKVE